MERYKLSKTDLLEYALAGAAVERSTQYEYLTEDEHLQLNRDIDEIKRRIKLVGIAKLRAAAAALAK